MSWQDKLCQECRGDVSKDLNQTLPVSAEKGHFECVKVLIEAGADVNTQGEHGHTALMCAAGKNNAECVKILIEAGADLDIQADDGDTALISAAIHQWEGCTKLLIEAGADLELQNTYGYTALLHAAHEGYDECAKMLVKAGADINVVNEFGESMFEYAGGNVEFVKHMVKVGADVNVLRHGQSLIMMSVFDDSTNVIRVLLRGGAKINLTFNNQNALQQHIAGAVSWTNGPNKTMVMLLYAAGETIDGTTVQRERRNVIKQVPVPDYLLHEELKFNLKHVCRQTIREHLINIDPHQHLFGRTPQLGLPESVTTYLLYNVSLAEDDDEEEKDDDGDDSGDDDDNNHDDD